MRTGFGFRPGLLLLALLLPFSAVGCAGTQGSRRALVEVVGVQGLTDGGVSITYRVDRNQLYSPGVNVWEREGETLLQIVACPFDFCCFADTLWDEKLENGDYVVRLPPKEGRRHLLWLEPEATSHLFWLDIPEADRTQTEVEE